MVDGSWVKIKRGNHTIVGWIEKTNPFIAKTLYTKLTISIRFIPNGRKRRF